MNGVPDDIDYYLCKALLGPNRRCLKPASYCWQWMTRGKYTIRSVCEEHKYLTDDPVGEGVPLYSPDEFLVFLILDC